MMWKVNTAWSKVLAPFTTSVFCSDKTHFSLLKSSAKVMGSQTSTVVAFLRNISPLLKDHKLQFTYIPIGFYGQYEVFSKDSKYLN